MVFLFTFRDKFPPHLWQKYQAEGAHNASSYSQQLSRSGSAAERSLLPLLYITQCCCCCCAAGRDAVRNLDLPPNILLVWEMVGAQPVPAVQRSQGIIQQLWIAGAIWARSSPCLAGSWLSAHPTHSSAGMRWAGGVAPKSHGSQGCALPACSLGPCWRSTELSASISHGEVAPVEPFSWNPLQLFMLSFVLPNYTWHTEVLMWLVENRARICICQTCFLTILGVRFLCLK